MALDFKISPRIGPTTIDYVVICKFKFLNVEIANFSNFADKATIFSYLLFLMQLK